MVDQFTNRQSLRSSSLKRRNQSSQSLQPSQQSTRVTRSRSRDVIKAEEREPAASRKRRKMPNDEENAVDSSAQEFGKRGARSQGPQGNNIQIHLGLLGPKMESCFPRRSISP